MGISNKYKTGLERYYTRFEKALAQQDLLGEPSPVNGHPVLDIGLGFTSFDMAVRPVSKHVSYKETRVDRIVREVFQDSDLYRSRGLVPSIDNEAIVDGFPVSFWFGFENPMLAVLFSMKSSRKRRRFNFTKKHKRMREREVRRRQTVEGRILTSSVLLMRDSVSFSSSASSNEEENSSDSEWGRANGTGEGPAILQYLQAGGNLSESDSDSEANSNSDTDESVSLHELPYEDVSLVTRQGERIDHMDDGTPGPYLYRHRG